MRPTKLNIIILLAALTGSAVAGPKPGGPAAGRIPDWLDTDGDGVVSEAERQAFSASRREARQGLHHQWDTNGDGVIDDDEKQAAIDSLRARIIERRCALFDSIAGEDGVILLEDFTAVHPVSRMRGEAPLRLFGLLDADGDGEVTKEEFLAATGPRFPRRGDSSNPDPDPDPDPNP